MAKIVETIFIIKISELVKDKTDQQVNNKFNELPSTIEQVVQELVGGDAIVEVETA